MPNDRFTLYAVDNGGTLIDSISDFSITANVRRMLQGSGGDVEPRFVAVGEQEPVINFSSLAIASALSAIGADGAAVATTATIFLQKFLQDGTREGTLKHLKGVVNAGLFVPVTLRASQGQPAVIEYALHTRYDGTNDPIVFTANQTLTGTPTNDEMYTVGPVVINGTELTGIQEITVQFGLEVFKDISGGEIWPKFLAIEERRDPLIRIKTREASAIESLGLSGVAQGTTDSKIYFRKKALGGANVAEATLEHVLISIDEGIINPTGPGGQHPTALEDTIEIRPVYDGTNSTFAVSTASAITVP